MFIFSVTIIAMFFGLFACLITREGIADTIGMTLIFGFVAFVFSIFISICVFLYALENTTTYNPSKSTNLVVECVSGKHLHISGKSSDIYVFVNDGKTIEKVYPYEIVVDTLANVPYIEKRAMCYSSFVTSIVLTEDETCVYRNVLHTKSLDL